MITGRRGFWEYDEDLLGSEKLKDLIILARTGEIVRSRHDLESALREVPILQGVSLMLPIAFALFPPFAYAFPSNWAKANISETPGSKVEYAYMDEGLSSATS